MKSKSPPRPSFLTGVGRVVAPLVTPVLARAAIAALAAATALAPGAAGAQQEPAAAGAGPAPPEFTIDEAGWTGGAQVEPASGRFSHCSVARDYGNGVTLVFLLSPRYELNIGMLNPAWDLIAAAEAAAAERAANGEDDEEETPLAQVTVDGSFAKEFPIRPINANVLMVTTGVDPQLFELLQKGNALSVAADQGNYRFPLTGTFAALDGLRGCVDAARRIIAAQVRAASAISVQDLASILRDSGLQDANVVPVAEGTPQAVAHKFAWTVGPLRGGLHQAPRGQAIEINRYADLYMDQFEAACDAAFQRASEPATVLREAFALKSATVQCGGEDGTFTALFFSLDGTHYSAFYHQGDVADRALVLDATDRVRQYVAQQAGGG